MERLTPRTPDLTARNIERIKELFPSVVTEGRDEAGEVVERIDFDLLRQELSDHVVDGPSERYQLDWPGKRAAAFAANTPIAKTLRPVREESVDFDTTQNIFIEGDNLDALKLLQESYLGKVKLIYIDPPYNTGHDFIYDDDFAETRSEYLERSGQTDEDGGRLVANTESNGRFHSDWLSMMYPRLKLARNLLADGGLIFTSVDENELPRLRQACDEVFGGRNFVATFVWEKRTNRENRKHVSYRHDYVLCYSRAEDDGAALNKLPMTADALSLYKNPDNDPRGPWKSDPAHAQAGHGTKSQFYDLVAPNGKVHTLPGGRCWAFSEKVMGEAIQDGRIWFGRDGNGVPRIKTYLHAKERGLVPETWISAETAGTNESAKNALKQLFDGVAAFDTPKPVALLATLMQIGSDSDSVVMDFFAGSGTTAHAVMALNAADGGTRRHITVQLDEATDPDSPAAKAGYQTIAELARERIRRAGAKIKEEAGLTGVDLDVGFRTFKIDSTNRADVLRSPEETEQLSLDTAEHNFKPDRTSEDLLFEVLISWGLEVSLPVEREMLDGHEVFTVDEGALIACFDAEVTADLVRTIAERQPLRAVFRDDAFATDDARINAEQVFAEVSPDTGVKVL